MGDQKPSAPSREQSINTDYTHISGLSLWTHQVNVGNGITVHLKGQVHPKVHLVMNCTNPRTCIEGIELRGEDSVSQGWHTAIMLNEGHHSILRDLHITGRSNGGAAAGIRLNGLGHPAELQLSQIWVFHADKALHIQGHHEGIKLSQVDFVAVRFGVFAEWCMQCNVVNSHISAYECCIVARNMHQSAISNNLFYKSKEGCDGTGIRVEGQSADIIISNNVFGGCSRENVMQAVVLAANARSILVTNNIFQHCCSAVKQLPGASGNHEAGNMCDGSHPADS